MTALIVVAVVLLACSNGANDNFKGVATLYGSGAASYRRALGWATITTLAGSLLALLVARGLVNNFGGRGLVPDAVAQQTMFLAAVGLGAALTVLVATRAGLPISTTHALTGALVGAGLVATRGHVALGTLGSAFLLPLALSPLVAIVLTLVAYPLFGFARRRAPARDASRVETTTVHSSPARIARGSGTAAHVVGTADIVARDDGSVHAREGGRLLNALHYLSAGAVGFARGLNDTPKIVALLVGARTVSPATGLGLVAVTMAAGGLLNARRIAETLGRRTTRMDVGQGFTSNLVTSFLVTMASRLRLPVSTTHVSVGSLFGIGLVSGTANLRMIGAILLAWITTLPLAALLGAIIYWLARAVF